MNDPLIPVSAPHAAGFRELEVGALAPHVGSVRLIDVREPDEYVGPLAHIAGAELIPLAKVGEVAPAWPRDQVIVLICRSGARSGRAAVALSQAGFSHVYNMSGGMIAWNDASLPVERA